MTLNHQNASRPLLDQRAALILLLGVLSALGAGVLTALSGGNVASAVLAGGAAFPVGVLFFHTIIA